MSKKKDNPFAEFARKSEENRKRPIPDDVIAEINELSREIEEEDQRKEELEKESERKIASKPLDIQL